MIMHTARHVAARDGRSPDGLRAEDLVREELIVCDDQTPLSAVARVMATTGIHCVLVEHDAATSARGWAILSDIEAAGPLRYARAIAAEAATSDFVTVDADAPLERAAAVMAEHETNRLVVVRGPSRRPIGVISAPELVMALLANRARDAGGTR